MGHKEPVLRPRCIGPGRARTQISFIHSFISESTLDGVKSRVSYVTGALAFLGNHSSFCALWLCIFRANEVAIPRNTIVFLLTICYEAVTIVLERCRPLFGQDKLPKNPIKECYRKLTEDSCLCQKGEPG